MYSYFVAGRRHGAGLYTYPCGSIYEGEYVAGKRCGIGTISTVLGFRFSGFWTDGLRNGQAKAAYPDGSIFDGCFQDDKRHGFGKVTFSNGDFFEGIFANDLPNGMGKYYHHGFGTYYGNFKKGLRSGSGTEMDTARKEGNPKWRSFDGVFEFTKGDVIVVNWKQGLPHGYGVCVGRAVSDCVAAPVYPQLHVIPLFHAGISSPMDCSSRAYGKMGAEMARAYCAYPCIYQSFPRPRYLTAFSESLPIRNLRSLESCKSGSTVCSRCR